MMGVFGSAFGIDIEDAVRHTSESIDACIKKFPHPVQHVLRHIIDDLVNSPLDDVRLHRHHYQTSPTKRQRANCVMIKS